MNPTNPIFYPNVSKMPSTGASDAPRKPGESAIQKGEFDQSLDQALQKTPQKAGAFNAKPVDATAPLNQVSQGIKFSAHAMQRLKERNISFNPEMMSKMNDAITKADSKGVQDTLILTDQAALIVSVPNRTVITAMDRGNLSGNVFTNIDGAVII